MSCELVEREGATLLLGGPRGPEEAAHLAGCAACRARLRSYERLVALVSQPAPGRGPRPGWQERVLAAEQPRPVRRRALTVVAGLAVAAMAVVLLVRRPGPPPWAQAVAVEIEPGRDARYRAGPSAARAVPGDTAVVRFASGGWPRAELRVFRGGELVFRCPPDPACRREGERISARVPLALVGHYRLLLAWSRDPLPAPAADVDADAARLLGAGARVRPLDDIAVR